MNPHVKLFKDIFKKTAKNTNRYDVFRDLVFMMAIAIENVFLKCEEKEKEYLNIIKKYGAEDQSRVCKLFAELTMAMEYEPSDILGSLFMELELGSSHIGQFFTPYPVCKLMAELNIGTDFEDKLSEQGYITVHEPASGSGSMLIAFAQSMLEKGYNPQKQMYFQAIDLDPVAAKMAYIQMSLLGLVGEVIVGNTLTLELHQSMKTPGYYLWGSELKYSSLFSKINNLFEDMKVSNQTSLDKKSDGFSLNLDLFRQCNTAQSLKIKFESADC